MGSKDHATAAQAHFPQSLDHNLRRLVVQLGCGLIGEDDVGIRRESPGHRDPLLLSEGQLEQAMVRSVLETNTAEPSFGGSG